MTPTRFYDDVHIIIIYIYKCPESIYNYSRDSKIMAEFVEYEIWLGTFEGEDFVWKTIKKFNSYDAASKFFEEYKHKQTTYSAEELSKVWGSGRIDIELRQGKKLINWVGMYYRRAADPDFNPEEDEEQEVEDSHLERID